MPEVYEYQAYLSTGVGKTWRVRFCDADGFPVMELLTPTQEQELFALRRRYPAGGSRVWQHTANKDERREPMPTTVRSDVARAITEEILRQNVDPFSNSRYTSIAPPINWEKVAEAAIKAADVEDLERKISLVMAYDSNLIDHLERYARRPNPDNRKD